MLTFIVIGRNEGWKLKKSLNSIYHTIKKNSIKDFEVIYVDSKSTDNSISIAKQYLPIRILRIEGQYNAAIARNIGAIEAKGSLLCFLDGDFELQSDFLKNINEFDFSKYILSGTSINYNYNYNWTLVNKEKKYLSAESIIAPLTGGYFIISKKVWSGVNGMRPYMKNGQDPDLGLRLAKKGYLMLRVNQLMIIHHTISYQHNIRIWRDILSKRNLYGTSVLIRDNFWNIYTIKRLIKGEKTLISLIISIIMSFFSHWFLLLYPLFTLLRALNRSKSILSFINSYTNLIVRDTTNFLGFFLFWPKKRIEILYSEVYHYDFKKSETAEFIK